MVRIETEPAGRLDGVMATAFHDAGGGGWVSVLINFTAEEQRVALELRNLSGVANARELTGFLTDKTTNMGRFPIAGNCFTMPPLSLVTVVGNKR